MYKSLLTHALQQQQQQKKSETFSSGHINYNFFPVFIGIFFLSENQVEFS